MRLKTFIGTIGVMAALIVAGGSAASADTEFAAQARAAGLTAAQITGLQGEVDRGLAEFGGKQVAANRIVAADGSAITYVLPGETYAHVLGDGLDGNDPLTPRVLCSRGAFCGWPRANFQGSGRTWFDCGGYQPIPSSWTSAGGGSWMNRQTYIYTTSMYDRNRNWVYTTPPPDSEDSHGNWARIRYISNNC